MKLSSGFNLLWYTPVYKTSISKLQAEQLIVALMMKQSTSIPANDSNSNLIDDIPLLEQLAEEKFGEYISEVYDLNLSEMDHSFRAWLTGSKNGYNMELHNHSGAPLVSVFYLLAEESDQGGELVMHDPRANANRAFPRQLISEFDPVVHTPSSGEVLIFPGYVYHSVRRYDSQMRLAVPVDLFIKE